MNKVVFPLDKRKAPAVPANTDWRDYRGEVKTPMVGIMIPKGAVVLDIDTYKGVTREDVEDALGCSLEWEDALLQGTLNGGEHYAFSIPNDVELVNSSDVLGLSGFDTRSSGKGYIATGQGYTDKTLFGVVETLHETTLLPKLPEIAIGKLISMSQELDEDDALLGAIAEQPLDLTQEEIQAYMKRLTKEHAEEGSTWLRVGMALSHQFANGEDG
jgi:hypothetical protein